MKCQIIKSTVEKVCLLNRFFNWVLHKTDLDSFS